MMMVFIRFFRPLVTLSKKHPIAVKVFLFCLFLSPSAAMAVDEFSYDWRLAKELQEHQALADYAGRQIQIMLLNPRYAEHKEPLQLEQARILYNTGRSAQADAIVAQIPSASPAGLNARLLQARAAFSRKDLATAKKLYADYFAKQDKPVDDSEDAIREFRQAVVIYSKVFEQEGNAVQSGKILDLLAKIPKDGDDAISERELRFRKAKQVLDTLEQSSLDGKPVDSKVVDGVRTDLEKLQWSTDMIMARSMVEVARAYYLQKNYDQALKTIKNSKGVFVDFDQALKAEKKSDLSPLPGAWLYFAKAQIALLPQLKAKDPAAAEKMLSDVIQLLQKIREQYPKSEFAVPATTEYSRARALTKSLFNKEPAGATAAAGGDARTPAVDEGALMVKIQEATQFASAKKPAEAADLYLAALQGLGRHNLPATIEAGAGLAATYTALNKPLLAQAAVLYLSDIAPEDDAVQQALFQTGQALAIGAKTIPDITKREAQIDDGMMLFERLVQIAPRHPRAPDLAYAVAENLYGRASGLGKQTQGMPEGPAKEQLKNRAREAYLAAVPKYLAVTQLFPAHERAVRSWYKLGWIYYSTDNPEKAAAAFLKYVAEESNPDPKIGEDRLEAKFRAADQMLFNNRPEEARVQLQELLVWLEPAEAATRNLDLNSAVAKRVKEDATAYLAWSYDLQGEGLRPKIAGLENRIAEGRARAEEIDARRAQITRSLDNFAAEQDKARKEETALEKALTSEPGVTERAKIFAEETQGKSGPELEIAKRIAEDKVQKIASEAVKNEQTRLRGEAGELKEERETLFRLKDEQDGRLKLLTTRAATAKPEAADAEARLADADSKWTSAQKAVTEWIAALAKAQTENTKLDQDTESLKAAVAQAKDTDTRDEARRAWQQAMGRLREVQKQLRDLRDQEVRMLKLQKTDLPELQQKKAQAATAATAARSRATGLEAEQRLAEAEGSLIRARLEAGNRAEARNAAAVNVLKNKGISGIPNDPEYAAATKAEIDARRKTLAGREAMDTVRTADLRKEDAAIVTERAELGKTLEAMQAERQPQQKRIIELKTEAETRFCAYLAAYPQGKQIPDVLSRRGTILLELKRIDDSKRVLTELSTKFPESKAAKQAYFNMGRALFETGDTAAAAEAFAKALTTARDLPAGNLTYIVEKMLSGDQPQLARDAALELLARAGNPAHPDQAFLAKFKEQISVQAAEALLATGEDQDRARAVEILAAVLKQNDRTAYFFQIKFLLARAKREMKPPDLDGAVQDLAEVTQYATDPLSKARAFCETGDLLVRSAGNDPAKLKPAAGRYMQVVLMADPANVELRPWLERALVSGAGIFAKIGDTAALEKFKKQYAETFPKGAKAGEMRGLGATPAPAAGGAGKK